MDRISGLPDELLVKILSFLPPKVVVSTSILSKRWESLWLWIPKLEFVIDHDEPDLPHGDFITRNLSLLKSPVVERFRLQCFPSSFQNEDIKHWVEITVSRCLRELDICYLFDTLFPYPEVLPSSLYSCKSLVNLKLSGTKIIVDVPRTGDLPSLKTLELDSVTYTNEDSLQLLLSYCPVLEDLIIERNVNDKLKTIVIRVPSLLRLSLPIDGGYSHEGYEIVAPSLKYLKVMDLYVEDVSYLKMYMPKVEEADLSVEQCVEKLFELITSVKRLSLFVLIFNNDTSMYRNGIVFNQLEHLKLTINQDYWSKLLLRMLEDSPKLRVLEILVYFEPDFEEYESASWYNDESSLPKCLLESLEIFEFVGYACRQEEKDFVSYILKNACHLKSSSISHKSYYVLE